MIVTGPIWLIGAGNMGGAMLKGWLGAGVAAEAIIVIDPHATSLPMGIVRHDQPPAGQAAVMVLAVKPQMLEQVAPSLRPAIGPDTLLISILAGVETPTLARHFPEHHAIVRAMPNLPALIGQGVTGLFSADAAAVDEARALLAPLGAVEHLADEQLFDALTALSGCGPAFLFRFVDALAGAGERLGLPAEQAMRLALDTVAGSAAMAVQSAENVRLLADRVASPGGVTREGLNVLDQDAALGRLLDATLAAAHARSRELAKA
jgi:pyrroline-5-carboxylate reductase